MDDQAAMAGLQILHLVRMQPTKAAIALQHYNVKELVSIASMLLALLDADRVFESDIEVERAIHRLLRLVIDNLMNLTHDDELF